MFRAHIAAARATGLPLIVHSRDADEVMARDPGGRASPPGPFAAAALLHQRAADCWRRAAALGAWFSVSGIATFKAADDVRAVIAEMPAERIIVETDCPYLAPVAHARPPQRAGLSGLVLAKLAEIRGWSLAEAEARTEDAFFALFDRIPAPMTAPLEFTILGCGSSGGVPRADGAWGACDPADPRNRRTRCSLMVRRPSPEGPER